MVGIRKICRNINEINACVNYNAQLQAEYESGMSMVKRQVLIPEPIYYEARFSFRPHNVEDWFVDKPTGDIIIWLRNRGETRFQYDPLLESQLETSMSL